MKTFPVPAEITKSHSECETIRIELAKLETQFRDAWNDYNERFLKFAGDTFTEATDKLEVILNPQFTTVYGTGGFLDMVNTYLYDTYGSRLSGVNVITGQRVPQLSFRNDAEHLAKVRRWIEDALVHMIPFSENMIDQRGKPCAPETIGFSMFDILDYDLSKSASVYILISPEKKIRIMSTSYGTTKYGKVMDFEEGIAFLRKFHYYESSSEDSDDE